MLFFKKKKDNFLPVQSPPTVLVPSPTPSSHSSRYTTPHQKLHKSPPHKASPPPLPPNWPSHMHNKCSLPKCDHPNPPQCAAGTYTCIGCRKGTYSITPAMAESAVVLSQKTYRFKAENKRQLQEREEEAERVREARDYQRYITEEEKRYAAMQIQIEKRAIIIEKQEQMRKKITEEEAKERKRNDERGVRAHETQHAVYHPVNAYGGHDVGNVSTGLSGAADRVPKKKVSLSDFPMPPQYHQSSKSSSRQRCVSGDRLKTKASTASLAPSFRSTVRPAPRQQIPSECYSYPEIF